MTGLLSFLGAFFAQFIAGIRFVLAPRPGDLLYCGESRDRGASS
jgi:hypothetical protein